MAAEERLTGLEFLGLLAGVVPTQVSGAVQAVSASSAQELERLHQSSTGETPAEVVADLILAILGLRPYAIEELREDEPDPNTLLCIAATHAYLHKVGRGLLLDQGSPEDGPTTLELELIAILGEAAVDPNFARQQLLARLNPLLPADVWASPVPTPMLAGVSACIAYAVSGVPPEELKKTRLIAHNVKVELESLGFSVRTCTEHPVGEDCSNDCAVNRNVDLLVVIYPRPSTRVGHQVKGVSDLLGLTLVLVPREVRDISCLFKSTELGRFSVKRYGGASEARREIQTYVTDNADLLDAHAVHRVTRDDWNRASFFELRERVARRMQTNERQVGPGLVTKARATHLVSSIDVYSGASITLINTVRDLVGLSPLGVGDGSRFESLFSMEQLYELEQLVASGDIPNADRDELVAQAAHGLVSAGRGIDRRSRTFLGPSDWLGEYDAMLAARRQR